MYRLTARLLLVLLLVDTFAQAAVALSATPPHACCLRRLHQQNTHDSQLRAPEDHSCCRSIASTQWAELRTPSQACVHLASNEMAIGPRTLALAVQRRASDSVRAPPAS